MSTSAHVATATPCGRSRPGRRRIACAALLAALFSGCGDAGPYPSRPVTLVCPWAVGGGTDTISRQMAAHLEQELGVPVNVVNATGGKGVTGHSRGLRAPADGYTLTMITFELNTLPWAIQAVDFTHDDFTPLATINEDAAALFVQTNATWQSLGELEDDIRANPGKLRASGTASGGAWHLALAGWLLAVEGLQPGDVVWVPSKGAGPSLEELRNGGVQMVCCSLPEAETLLADGRIRCLGVMSDERAVGYADVPTFQEQGSDWSLVGWRGLAVPRGTPEPVVERLAAAVDRVVRGETRLAGAPAATFPEFMESRNFNLTVKRGAACRAFLADNDAKFKKLLTSEAFAGVSSTAVGPMLFPTIMIGLLAVVTLVMVVRTLCTEQTEPVAAEEDEPPLNAFRFLLVVGAVVGYFYLAPITGFLTAAGLILFFMLWSFGTRARTSALVTVLFVPAVYLLFAHALRVDLPRGWLEW